MSQQSFESWAIIELFGRNIIAGKVSEQVIGNQGFVRVDVPATNGQDAYTKFYGPGSIYCITPTDESTARSAAEGMRVKPVEVWKLNLPQLQSPKAHRYEDEDIDKELEREDMMTDHSKDNPRFSMGLTREGEQLQRLGLNFMISDHELHQAVAFFYDVDLACLCIEALNNRNGKNQVEPNNANVG